MGWGFRKSKKIGNNTRVNISKSGIGMSTGVKGARVGANKRGTYVAGGKNGFYYRKNLGNNNKSVVPEEGMSILGTIGLIFSLLWNIVKVIFYGVILFYLIKFIIFIIKS